MPKTTRYFHCSFTFQKKDEPFSIGDATMMSNVPFNMYRFKRWVMETHEVKSCVILSWQELTEDEVNEMIEELPTPKVSDESADKGDGGDENEQESEVPAV